MSTMKVRNQVVAKRPINESHRPIHLTSKSSPDSGPCGAGTQILIEWGRSIEQVHGQVFGEHQHWGQVPGLSVGIQKHSSTET